VTHFASPWVPLDAPVCEDYLVSLSGGLHCPNVFYFKIQTGVINCHLAEKTDFGAIVEYRRLLNGSVSRLQNPHLWKDGEQFVEFAVPHDLHTTHYSHART